ncbi:flagellar biosynthesis protein FlhF [Candidatus Magnetaquicoccus inordinatus]|uniref:flagellar biosynthesis protein FlhF n=1 Tax=Candidatus Magnetaquicoccus inordinatus TaxID=2496818 RepID=UPI00102CC13F|nr:flagellar biosynthesis protein FlhF [Candidatus Magnetaquicoccus inordinatus]
MKVSTFQARDMREVLKLVKEQLGADAVILSTRSIREPGSGLSLGRTLIEVTACPGPNARPATAEPAAASTPPAKGETIRKADPAATPWNSATRATPGRFSRVVDDPVPYPPATASRNTASAPERSNERTPPPTAAAEPPPLPNRMAEAAASVAPLTEEATESAPESPQNRADLTHPLLMDLGSADKLYEGSTSDLAALDAESKRNYSWLIMHGVEEPIARRIMLMDRSGKERGLTVALQRALKFRDPLAGTARVIALVGPTGVGKTTTLAKIAADLILNRQRSVGMITLDTFRVGAVAQLETYAKLLQVRLVVARTASEVKAGLHSLNRCDYVLVDTVGSSPYNRRQVNSTASLLPDIAEEREVILCMAANVREAEQQAIYRRFSVLQPTGLIFTKLDETVTYGGILNVCIKANLPLTLYTDGQRVPENLGWMSASTLAKWFARDMQAELQGGIA